MTKTLLFEKLFYGQMQNYPDKFIIVNWNSFHVTCKNKRAFFIHSINFTGPLLISCQFVVCYFSNGNFKIFWPNENVAVDL